MSRFIRSLLSDIVLTIKRKEMREIQRGKRDEVAFLSFAIPRVRPRVSAGLLLPAFGIKYSSSPYDLNNARTFAAEATRHEAASRSLAVASRSRENTDW